MTENKSILYIKNILTKLIINFLALHIWKTLYNINIMQLLYIIFAFIETLKNKTTVQKRLM